jgi:hypothetical protein
MLDNGEEAISEEQVPPQVQGPAINGRPQTNGNGLVFKHYDPSGPNPQITREDEEMR